MTAVVRFLKVAYGSIASKPSTVAPALESWQWNDGEPMQWNDGETMEIG